MRAGRNTPLFSEKDGMAFGAADPFLEGRRLVPCSAASGAEAQRGYNQAELLALEIGKQLGAPGGEQHWLIRTKKCWQFRRSF